MATATAPTLAEIQEARQRLQGVARETPVISSETLGRLSGRPVWLKAENLQRTGSFKIRGAYNRISLLTDTERAAGVVTASAGNHGQAVAWAAREAGVRATVFMPEDAPTAKIEATKSYGAEVVLVGVGFDEAAAAAQERDAAGETYVHAFEDPLVVAGQGTLGLELAEQLAPEVQTLVVPIGGGGLAAGIALAVKELRPEIGIVGVQPAACAPFAGLAPTGSTIADGIAVKHPGELTRSLLDGRLDGVVTVTDAEIAGAILLVSERCKLTVEGAGAASVAALLAGKLEGSGAACALLSGGNIDASMLIEILRHGLTRAGRYLVVRTRVDDRPGNLADLLAVVAEERANVLGVDHHREGMDLPVTGTEIELTLAMRDEEHCVELLAKLAEQGYATERLR
ncbi:MAG TPA: threonine ammonia-lyase [Gaiellaceae bacterium]|nr:threonine ammonia-lyase [Gaiellaceae bacterium]